MLSRIADAIYWMSRYLERADNTSRLLEINLLHLMEAEDTIDEADQWRPLLAITSTEERFLETYPGQPITAARVLRFMTQERTNTSSIRQCLRGARENARTVRDRISRDMWEVMNDLWLMTDARLQRDLAPERAAEFYSRVRDAVAEFHGQTLSTMMRGEAFGFHLMGTFLERADMTARIMDVKYHLLLPDSDPVGSALDYYQWAALLKSLSGFEAFRRLYHAGMRPIDVWELVVFNRGFPRSLQFCADHMRQALASIDESCEQKLSCDAVDHLRQRLKEFDAGSAFRVGPHEFLAAFLDQTAAVHAALSADFFETSLGDGLCVI